MRKKLYNAVGLMSGTSLDGIDAALLKTDGSQFIQPIGFYYYPYENSFRERIKTAIEQFKHQRIFDAKVEQELTELHAKTVERLLQQHSIAFAEIDLIGFHGHTLFHAPHEKLTKQMGDGMYLAKLTGCDVVYDFRSGDVLAGGQGAPLVPFYHDVLANTALEDRDYPVAFLNIGGVANVTVIKTSSDTLNKSSGDALTTGSRDRIIAFDTGPGNALMNTLVQSFSDYDYDKDGEIAASGKPKMELVNRWLEHSFFKKEPPKSLDYMQFSQTLNDVRDMALPDALATQLFFVVNSVKSAMEKIEEHPKHIFVCGGGRHNKHLLLQLKHHIRCDISSCDSLTISAKPVNGDAMEAEAFAYLAVRSMLGLPISSPKTTGIRPPAQAGGVFCPAEPSHDV